MAKVLNEDGTESEKVVWDAAKHENAKTSDIVKFETDTDNFKNVVVKFDGGQELTANKNGYFFMVLPGADYTRAALAVTVHATIDGEHYMSQAAINPAKDVRLLPALPYSADEYDANGDMKASKGTSMTYTINGAFEPYSAAVISGYNAISNYDELATFITDVAYRGEKLVEISKAQAEQMLEDKTYDAQKYFVITADEDAPIALDDDLVVAFNNACVIEGKSASIQFLGNTSKLVLGDITWNAEVNRLFKFGKGLGNVYAKGTVVLKANPGAINVLAGANVTLESDEAITVRNNNGATVNINSEAAHNVSSTYGTVNVMVSTEATVNNGVRIDTDRNSKQTCPGVSKLNIADGVTMTGTVTNTWEQTVNTTGTKTYYAEVNVGNAIVTITNNSKVVVNSNKAKLTVSGYGTVDNTAGAVVRNQGNNTVFATVSTFKDLDVIYDDLSGLNKLVVVGSVQNDLPSDKWNLKSAIETIDFNSGSSLAIGNATWDWTGKDININANVTWMGRDASVSVIKVTLGSINVTGKNKFNVVDIDLYGYQRVVDNNDELAEAIAAGESKVILNEGDYLLDLYNDNVARKSLTITGTKNSKVRFGNQQVRLELFENVTIENCEFDEIMTGKNWGELVFSTGKANGVYTVRNCTFKGIGTQGIYINEENSSAVYNIENCTFNGDFGSEGAIVIQCNTDVKHTVNIKGCTFNNIPSTSHKVCLVRPNVGIPVYKGWTLNTDLNASDIFTMSY